MRSVIVLAVLCAVAFAAVRKNVKFTPLDPDVTAPTDFWLNVWNPVPQTYMENPRYPVVPPLGPLAIDVLHELYPNGTVPKVPPKPTNVWYKNLWGYEFNETQQWNGIYPYPYIVEPRKGMVNIMYPGAPVNLTENRAVQVGFDVPEEDPILPGINPRYPIKNASSPWMTMAESFDITLQIFNGVKPRILNLTELAATIEYRDENNASVATAYFVKGSPFINVECRGALLAFGAPNPAIAPPIISINGNTPGNGASGTDFVFTVAVGPAHPQGQTWHAFFENPVSIAFPIPPTPLNVTAPYTGLLQLGCGELDDKMGPLLQKAKGVYAKGAEITYDIDDSKNQLTMHYNFVKGGNGTNPLAMLALRHHVNLMGPNANTQPSAYWVSKGNMTAVIADSWQLTYNLTSVGFGDQLFIDSSMREYLLEATMVDYQNRVGSCPGDNATWMEPGYKNMELYAYTRDIAQMTDVAIALETLGKRDEAIKLTKKTYECISPLLRRPAQEPQPCPPPINNTAVCVRNQMDLFYDEQFGGIITGWFSRFAGHYCQCDKAGGPYACRGFNYCDNPRGFTALGNYGNALYNDHHFQYGYVLKALSWILYYQEVKQANLTLNSTVIKNITKQALIFARDIANPDAKADPYFTSTRHKDFFDGHSWAEGYDYSGRAYSWVNQQSGGEAINGYYGVYLLGLAVNDSNVRDWGRINLATEMYSVHQYQHLSNKSKDRVDQPTEAVNKWGKCISTLYGTGFSGNTYFGQNVLFQCGITIAPISPVTREFLTADWAMEAFDWLSWHINRTGFCVFYDPLTMSENPCPGQYNSTWAGNEWACCPTFTEVGPFYAHNQWRAYPDWTPYLYFLQSFGDAKAAVQKLTYSNGFYAPTDSLKFPYLANRSAVFGPEIVGFEAGITLSGVVFDIATRRRPHP